MTNQQPEDKDVFADYMRHITDHGCDRTHCKIAQDLALQALVDQAQMLGFYDHCHTSTYPYDLTGRILSALKSDGLQQNTSRFLKD